MEVFKKHFVLLVMAICIPEPKSIEQFSSLSLPWKGRNCQVSPSCFFENQKPKEPKNRPEKLEENFEEAERSPERLKKQTKGTSFTMNRISTNLKEAIQLGLFTLSIFGSMSSLQASKRKKKLGCSRWWVLAFFIGTSFGKLALGFSECQADSEVLNFNGFPEKPAIAFGSTSAFHIVPKGKQSTGLVSMIIFIFEVILVSRRPENRLIQLGLDLRFQEVF